MIFRFEELKIVFHDFVGLSKSDLQQVLDWRNDFSVRRWMKNDSPISENQHFLFVDGLARQDKSFYWAVSRKSKMCAVVYVHRNLSNHAIAEWGYYMAPQFQGTGVSLEICFYSLKVFFECLKVEELTAFTLKENHQNIALQDVLGFTFDGETTDNDRVYIKTSMALSKYQIMPKDYKHFLKSTIWKKK